MNIGPLLANGGTIATNSPGPQANSPIDSPTPILTDALLGNDTYNSGSVAIDTGNNSLVSSSDSFDERGAGYERVFNSTVDVGAFEFEIPSIVSFNPSSPSSIGEGQPSFGLTISGVDFDLGNTTVTVMGASSATWAPSGPTQLPVLSDILSPTDPSASTVTVNVPVVFREQDGPLTFIISVPDGSGIPGHVLTATDTFGITPPTSLSISYGGGSVSYVAGATVSLSPTFNGDPNVQPWTITSGQLPGGLSMDSITGIISGTILDSDSFGNYPLTITATDDGFSDNTITLNLMVIGPSITSLNPPQLPEGNGAFNLIINGSDFDNVPAQTAATVTVSSTAAGSASTTTWETNPSTLTIVPGSLTNTSLMVIVPATILEQDGPLIITVTVPDGSGIQGHDLTATDTFTIDKPMPKVLSYTTGSATINDGGSTSNLAGTTVDVLPITGTDPNLISWSATGLPAGLNINTVPGTANSGMISGTILDSDSFGSYPVVVTAIDDGTTDSIAFTWNVIGPQISLPASVGLSPSSVQEGSNAFALTISGSGLENNGTATVTVYGSASTTTWAPTTFLAPYNISSTQLTVNVPANILEQDGPIPFTVSVPDGSGVAGHTLTSNSMALTITPHTFSFSYASQNTLEGRPVTPVVSNEQDPNVQGWTASNLPNGLTINSTTGAITGTTALGSVGTYTVTVGAVDDGVSESTTFNWKVTGPTLTMISPSTEPENSGPFTMTLSGSDFLNNGGVPTVSISGTLLTPISLSSDTIMTVNVPNSLLQQDGPLFVSVSVPDGSGVPGNTLTSGSVSFAITPPPSLTFTYAPQTNTQGTTVSVSSSNTDPNVGNWQASNLPPGLNINNVTGDVFGTIQPGAAGTYSVVVTAFDDGTMGSDTFSWVITPPNKPPTFSVPNPTEAATVDGGPSNAISYSVSNFATSITAGPANQNSETVHFNVIGDSNPSLFTSGTGQPTITVIGSTYPESGTLSFQTVAGASGTASITVTLQNSGGTAAGGNDTSTPFTFVINVTPIDQPPSFTGGPDQTATIDDGTAPVSYSVPWATNIAAGPSAESWQTVSFTVVTRTSPTSLFSVHRRHDRGGRQRDADIPDGAVRQRHRHGHGGGDGQRRYRQWRQQHLRHVHVHHQCDASQPGAELHGRAESDRPGKRRTSHRERRGLGDEHLDWPGYGVGPDGQLHRHHQ